MPPGHSPVCPVPTGYWTNPSPCSFCLYPPGRSRHGFFFFYARPPVDAEFFSRVVRPRQECLDGLRCHVSHTCRTPTATLRSSVPSEILSRPTSVLSGRGTGPADRLRLGLTLSANCTPVVRRLGHCAPLSEGAAGLVSQNEPSGRWAFGSGASVGAKLGGENAPTSSKAVSVRPSWDGGHRPGNSAPERTSYSSSPTIRRNHGDGSRPRASPSQTPDDDRIRAWHECIFGASLPPIPHRQPV